MILSNWLYTGLYKKDVLAALQQGLQIYAWTSQRLTAEPISATKCA